MKMRIVFIILGLAGTGLLAEEKKSISGHVVDTDFYGVRGVEIAPKWQIQNRGGELTFYPQTPERIGYGVSETEGAFTFSMQSGWWAGLLAYNKQRSHGAITSVAPDAAPQDIELKLKPLVPVRYEITEDLPEVELERVNISFDYQPASLRKQGNVLSYFSEPKGHVLLPPGDYTIEVSAGQKWGNINQAFTIPEGGKEVDLGRLVLPPVKWAGFPNGEAPDLRFSQIRGLPKEFSMESLRGKWVLLNFWAHWCGPCHRDMVRVLDLADELGAPGEKYEILTIDCSGDSDFSTTDEKTAELAAKYWNGRVPYFPQLLDGNTSIRRDYGVRLLPTKILIDPEGKVATKAGGPDAISQLREILKRNPQP